MHSKLVNKIYSEERIVPAMAGWLKLQPHDRKIIVEQNRNLGDTLHLIPIIRHYRKLYPKAMIIFLVGSTYSGAHEYNQDLDRIYTIKPLGVRPRIALRKELLKLAAKTKDIQVISPSIFPYGEIWKELAWSHADIATQYFVNAGINKKELKGFDRSLFVNLTQADRDWAKGFVKKHKLKKFGTLEYNSYSHPTNWKIAQFVKLATELKKKGIQCVSLAGPKERPVGGTVNGTGTSWRKTVALMEHATFHVGVGSGLTMLAATVDKSKRPKIIEVAVSPSISMDACGYADSISIRGDVSPARVIKQVCKYV